MGQADWVCLQEAFVQGLTLVTYDLQTIPLLLRRWTEETRSHSGVILVDERPISSADSERLVRALATLAKKTRMWDWTERVVFLRC